MKIDLGRVLYALPGLVWTASADGCIDFVNRHWVEYAGPGLDEAHGGEWAAIVHPDELPALLDWWNSILATGQPSQIETRVRRFDGVYRWFRFECSPVSDPEGRLERWCGVGTDIQCSEQTGDSRHQDDLAFQLIVNSVPIPVAVTTPTGAVETLNQPTLDYFGRTLEELKGWSASDVVHPDDLERTVAAQIHAHVTGSTYNVESRHRRADGVYRWFNVLGLPLRDADGDILRWIHLQIDIDDRKQAEEALVRSERQSMLVLDNIATLVSLLDANGGPQLINRQIIDYTGRSESELKKWGGSDLVHPEDLAPVTASFKAGIASRLPFDIVYRMRRFDGVYRWFQGRHRPLKDDVGNVIQWCVSVDDIDDRKTVEESLRAAEREARLAMDSVDGMICLFTPEGMLNGGNRQLLDYFQLPLEEVMKWATNGITHPDDLRHCIDTFMASVSSGEPYDFETRFRRFDGIFRWFQLRGLPLRNAEGDIIRWYGLLTDIDDRKHAEEELRRSEAFLAEGQHLAGMGNLSWKVNENEIIWSEPLYRIFGFEPGEIVSLDLIASRVHPDDMPLMADMVQRAVKGEEAFEYQHRIILPDGTVKYLHLIAHRAKNQLEQIEYIGAVLDITQRRLAEEAHDRLTSELAQVTKVMTLGVMAASIAHEVNQPLSGIITNASTSLRMLAADPPNLDGARETARRTIRDGNRAADVVTRLRALFTQTVAPTEQVDLNEAIREVIALCWNDLQRARVTVRAELADDLPLIQGDRVQLQQVIMNLLRNASDAMSNIDKRLRDLVVTTRRDPEDAVSLAVCDTGTGVEPGAIGRIFDAFYTTKSDGMGMGLSVSRTIIESHGGRIWAEPNEGPGTTFFFVIPSGEATSQLSGPAGERPTSSAVR